MSTSIQVGDRFETKDWRDEGRIVEVVEVIIDKAQEASRPERAERFAAQWGSKPGEVSEWLRAGETRFRVRTEAHPKNPSAVGNVSRISERTLHAKYRKVSR
jgi:hypothetical protein